MRLWHKDLLPYLPRQQILGQWRECCLIAKTIKETGTPNHLLVNRIMDYPLDHFWSYGMEVAAELIRRGYQVNENRFTQYFNSKTLIVIPHDDIFNQWHTDGYMTICYYNLLEKAQCKAIEQEDFQLYFNKIYNFYNANYRR